MADAASAPRYAFAALPLRLMRVADSARRRVVICRAKQTLFLLLYYRTAPFSQICLFERHVIRRRCRRYNIPAPLLPLLLTITPLRYLR